MLARVQGSLVPAVGAVEVTQTIEFGFGTDTVGMYSDRAQPLAANQNSLFAFIVTAYADVLVQPLHKLGSRFGTALSAIDIVTLTIKRSYVMFILIKIKKIESVKVT